MKEIIKKLIDDKKTISCMESCTGGLLANEITNVDGASNTLKMSLVTYSNEYKEYFGVSKETIEKYTVYSNEVSSEMAKVVSSIAKSDYGIGITGQLGTKDLKNDSDNINTVYISIYDRCNDEIYNYSVKAMGESRLNKKYSVVNYIKEKLYEIYK